MYLSFALVCFLNTVQILKGDGSVCTMPTGKTGKCIPVTKCPALLQPFNNPKKGSEPQWREYVCENEEYLNKDGTLVCCDVLSNEPVITRGGFSSDSTINLTKIAELSDKRYCGYQHRDDYELDEEGISIDEYPWLAKIVVHVPRVLNYTRCSGSLFSARHVLTTAECLDIDDNPTFVRLGEFHTQNQTDCVEVLRFNLEDCSTYEDYDIEEKILHPFYSRASMLNNIALIKLKENVFFTDEEPTKCRTPNGEAGVCIPITSCPKVLDAFANATNKTQVYYLNNYICKQKATLHERIKVCCGTSSSFTVFGKENRAEDLSKLSDMRYCGLQHKDDYITTDDGIGIDEFPWVAAIIVRRNGSSYTTCTGTLINERYVLTSGFCRFFLIQGDAISVRLGEFYRTNDTDCIILPDIDAQDCSNYEDYDIEEIIPHPFFDAWNGLNSILLLRLKKRVVYSDFIRPICLPIRESNIAQLNDTLFTSGFIAGFENFSMEYPDYISPFKTKGAVTLVPNEQCNTHPDFATTNIVYSNTMCTVHVANRSTCLDNEGSPLMFERKHQWHIEGILSHGFCAVTEGYTKVSKYLTWIQANMRL